MKKRVLLTGATGLLGKDLWRTFSGGYDVLSVSRRWNPCVPRSAWRCADVRRPSSLTRILRVFKPQIILHAAAIANIDYCERHPEEAFQTNTQGTRNLLMAAGGKALFVYLSTDNVFDGTRKGYREEDAPRPRNSYGFSKLWGEHHVRSLAPRHLIVRTCWFFGFGPNFVTKLMAGDPMKAAEDWVATPTYTADLAGAVDRLVRCAPWGTYHITNGRAASRWDVVRELKRLLGPSNGIRAVKCRYASLPFAAQRPIRSRLVNDHWRRLGWSPLRSWKSALGEFVDACVDTDFPGRSRRGNRPGK
ncbi:MAG: NAD(P)-dependent oxidoreductase [Elusimicrobia bacterium]|nr:NAD(P)-dependent oxidoreductase [Elusimicrobiota bacterium]